MKSVLVYTIHKAGSTFLNLLLRQTCRRFGIDHLSENDGRYFDTIQSDSWKAFIENEPSPSCFGPIRGSSNSAIFPANLDDFSIVLHLRDPRDVLTSLYFSYAYSHKVRPGRFEATDQQREQWRSEGIDNFVLKAAGPLQATYSKLCALLDRPNLVVVHYETMVLNYPQWLADVLDAFVHLAVPAKKKRHMLLPQFVRRQKIKSELFRRHKDSFCTQHEDIYSHKRKVIPGDHRDKLQADTIGQLDQIFANYFCCIKQSESRKLVG